VIGGLEKRTGAELWNTRGSGGELRGAPHRRSEGRFKSLNMIGPSGGDACAMLCRRWVYGKVTDGLGMGSYNFYSKVPSVVQLRRSRRAILLVRHLDCFRLSLGYM
jgi:hypothetical protein